MKQASVLLKQHALVNEAFFIQVGDDVVYEGLLVWPEVACLKQIFKCLMGSFEIQAKDTSNKFSQLFITLNFMKDFKSLHYDGVFLIKNYSFRDWSYQAS